MARSEKKDSISFLSLLVPVVTEVIPIFFQAWQHSQSGPAVDKLEEENLELSRRINDLERKTRWMQYFLIALGLFFSAFLILFVIKG
tara:strand:+ start:122 stop:382 length:261 start_codon:yes stop_codon:yes gene_type:complete